MRDRMTHSRQPPCPPMGTVGVLVLLALFSLSCRPQEVAIDAQVTPVASQSAAEEATREQAVQVPEKETIQVIVTSAPTPLPQGGTLVRAVYQDAQTANPITAADTGSRVLTDLIFAKLLEVDPFTGAIQGHLAESWTVSEDGKSYTFYLREGLAWSDGTQLTAHDFHFSYAALSSGNLDTPNQRHAQAIDEIEVLDNGFTLKMLEREKNKAILNRVCTAYWGAEKAVVLRTATKPDTESPKKKSQNEQRLKQKALSHPLVAEAIEIFDGKLIDVKLR